MTRQFVVIEDFKDLKDHNHIYRKGDFYPRVNANLDEARADELASTDNARGEQLIVEILAKAEAEKEDQKDETFPKLLGGGYYELSNGEKVRGKDEAVGAEKELQE